MKRLAIAVLSFAAWGQDLGSLKRVSIAKPSELGKFVRDQNRLVALGKALFWDMQLEAMGGWPARPVISTPARITGPGISLSMSWAPSR